MLITEITDESVICDERHLKGGKNWSIRELKLVIDLILFYIDIKSLPYIFFALYTHEIEIVEFIFNV